MNKLKFLFVLIIALVLMSILVSCAGEVVGISRVYVDDNGNAIVEYENGETKSFGKVVDTPVTDAPPTTEGISVKKTYVNEEMHLIVEYSNGKVEDLGYVGVEVKVEVEPPLYKVIFYDAEGNKLSEQEVYKGKAAKAPEAPAIPDMVFVGWDKEFTNVTEDLEIRPEYTGADTFTVTFKDELGNVLATETVIVGKAAKAPTPPTREDKIFTGWDKTFDKVTADLTVTAQYRAKKTVTVTFNDYSGVLLGTVSAKEGDTVKAPVTPTREGYRFTGWSASLTNVTANKTVTAQYQLSGGNNVFDISYKLGNNNTLTVTFAVKGTVKFCGMEGTVTLPDGITVKSVETGDGASANVKDGTLYFMFASNSGKNVTATTTVMTLTVSYPASASSLSFDTAVSDIYDQEYKTVDHIVIGETVKLK